MNETSSAVELVELVGKENGRLVLEVSVLLERLFPLLKEYRDYVLSISDEVTNSMNRDNVVRLAHGIYNAEVLCSAGFHLNDGANAHEGTAETADDAVDGLFLFSLKTSNGAFTLDYRWVEEDEEKNAVGVLLEGEIGENDIFTPLFRLRNILFQLYQQVQAVKLGQGVFLLEKRKPC